MILPLPQNFVRQIPRNIHEENFLQRTTAGRDFLLFTQQNERKKMKLSFLAFTEKGFALAESLAQTLGGSAMRCNEPDSLQEWTEKQFADAQGLVFVGAVGIAVRAIAPWIDKKWKDPAVVAVDECARFAVPLLSGHLGGANRLARAISEVCGAQAVITTATDCNGVFAVDEWARCQGLSVIDPQHIKLISGRLLAGGRVSVYSAFPVEGECPPGVVYTETLPADVAVSVRREEAALSLAPKIVALGVGCRKGTSQSTMESVLQQFLQESGLQMQAIYTVASIDLKKEEPGLVDFCRSHGWEFRTCSAGELRQVSGEFTSSAFVSQVAGVDNVCERSAVFVSGGRLCCKKFTSEGVAMAAAMKPLRLNWDR